ncbi:MAG TPA: O-antigen ligase family protein [Blastocatellia bacterium]|nr:O-antigen ligase family protein [Blastocatellia bacterium]
MKLQGLSGGATPDPNRVFLYLLAAILVLTPLVASGTLLHEYSVPKYVVLLLGASALVGLITHAAVSGKARELAAPSVLAIAVFSVTGALSCLLSSNRIISLQGAFPTLMGYSTYLCFAAVFVAVIIAVRTRRSFEFLLRAITIAGFAVSLVGLGQLAGIVPGDPQAAETIGTASRIYSTLGHPDFAGNYLIYVVFAAEATALISTQQLWKVAGGATSVLGVLAIIFTGTRGAWLGLLAGGAIAASLAMKHGLIPIPGKRQLVRLAAIAVAAATIAAAGLLYTQIGSPIRARISAVASEGFTGTGRTTDWSLSIRMLKRYWPIGCGPDMFRVAQLPFKTDEYSFKTTGVDAEDAHSAYLSTLVTFGGVGFAIYILLIILAFRGLGRAITTFQGRAGRSCSIALASGLGGVLVHDLFLHHAVVTGLYFFTFLALGCQLSRVADEGKESPPEERASRDIRSSKFQMRKSAAWAFIVLPLVIAGLYSYSLLAADHEIHECLAAATAADRQQTIRFGQQAAGRKLYQTDYSFYYGGALDELSGLESGTDAEESLKLALEPLRHATSRTLSPVSSLASLALVEVQLGDLDGARAAMEKAQQIDPHTYLTHLVWSRLYLKQGHLEESILELKHAQRLGAPQVRIDPLQTSLGRALSVAHNQRLWDLFNGRHTHKKGDRSLVQQNQQYKPEK